MIHVNEGTKLNTTETERDFKIKSLKWFVK